MVPVNRLSDQARARIEAANRERTALEALGQLAALLDPGEKRSRRAVAGEIAARLGHFQSAGYRLIAKGYRQPRNTTETLMLAILASDLPGTPDNLARLLG